MPFADRRPSLACARLRGAAPDNSLESCEHSVGLRQPYCKLQILTEPCVLGRAVLQTGTSPLTNRLTNGRFEIHHKPRSKFEASIRQATPRCAQSSVSNPRHHFRLTDLSQLALQLTPERHGSHRQSPRGLGSLHRWVRNGPLVLRCLFRPLCTIVSRLISAMQHVHSAKT